MAMFRRLIFLILLSTFAFALPQQLKKTDIRNSMEEMFTYHVEYKELTPLLIKRSFKSYIEQFDTPKIYMLQSEVKSFFELSSSMIESVIVHYYTDEYPEYLGMNSAVVKAIQRARGWRQEIADELVAHEGNIEVPSYDGSFQYAQTPEQLKGRIRAQMVRFFLSEQKSKDPSYWTMERKKKIFSLLERRFNRYENAFLGQGDGGEHFLCLHILKAMARSLDAHTAYFSPDEAFEMRTSLEKQFEGVGVVLKEGVDGVEVADLVKGGPAARCGQIHVGDCLVEIDGSPLANASYEQILDRLKGNGKKEVALGFQRFSENGSAQMVHVDLMRERILMEEERLLVKSEPFSDGIIGKLTLPSFYESTGSSSCEADIREALRELKKQGNLKGLVLDMRENLGGFLNQAVKVGGLFITSGVVVISKYAQGEIQYMRNIDPRLYFSGPFVILTSKASASAAEIVAQALQDYGVALVVGDERTYGKGTIQYQTVTDDEAATFFKVTVGRYYTVSGRSTQIEGVQADIVVPTEFAPYNIGERYLEYPLSNDRVPPAYTDPLADVDGQAKAWFQKNYLPYIQKKESVWHKMLPQLQSNSRYRIEHDPNFKIFLSHINPLAEASEDERNWGTEDLQMGEAVSIVKDMIMLQKKS